MYYYGYQGGYGYNSPCSGGYQYYPVYGNNEGTGGTSWVWIIIIVFIIFFLFWGVGGSNSGYGNCGKRCNYN